MKLSEEDIESLPDSFAWFDFFPWGTVKGIGVVLFLAIAVGWTVELLRFFR